MKDQDQDDEFDMNVAIATLIFAVCYFLQGC